MNKTCKNMRMQFEALRRSPAPEEVAVALLKSHAASCRSCRDFFSEKAVSLVLQQGYADDNQLTSESFMPGLHRKLALAGQASHTTVFADSLSRAGLVLAPALAVLLILLTVSAAYVSKIKVSSDVRYSVEDVILSADADTGTDIFLYKTTVEEL